MARKISVALMRCMMSRVVLTTHGVSSTWNNSWMPRVMKTPRLSSRGEALTERRRRNLAVDQERLFVFSWTSEGLNVPARGLLSRVMDATTRDRPLVVPTAAPLDFEIALPVSIP